MTQTQTDIEMKQYDVFRDSYLRYLGYANEVGEAFRPLIPRKLVNLSYGISTAYVFADAGHKSLKKYESSRDIKSTSITAVDVLIWQLLASIIIPGFTINRITWGTSQLIRNKALHASMKKIIPTAVGLASIPIVIKPIDRFVDWVMDRTFREIV